MYVLGDIGNSEIKIYLVSSQKKIIKRISFSTNNINYNVLKNRINRFC